MPINTQKLLQTSQNNNPAVLQRKPSLLCKIAKYFFLSVLSLFILLFLCVFGGGYYLNTDNGSAFLTEKINSLLQSLPNGLHGKCKTVRCSLPNQIEIENLQLRDQYGVFFTGEKVFAHLTFSNLPESLEISEISLSHSNLSALPVLPPEDISAKQEKKENPLNFSETIQSVKEIFQNVPTWLPKLIVQKCEIIHFNISEKITPIPMDISCELDASFYQTGFSANCKIIRHISENNNPECMASLNITPELNISCSMNLSDMGFACLLPIQADSLNSELTAGSIFSDNALSISVKADTAVTSENKTEKLASFTSSLSLPFSLFSETFDSASALSPLKADMKIYLSELTLPSSAKIGNTDVLWKLRGPLNDLSSQLTINNKTLAINNLLAENTLSSLNITKINIPALLNTSSEFLQSYREWKNHPSKEKEKIVPELRENNAELLQTDLSLSSTVNGEKMLFETAINLNEIVPDKNITQNGMKALSLFLKKLNCSAAQSNLNASLSVAVPLPLKKHSEKSLVALLEIPYFEVNGDIKINVENWKTFSQLSGIPLSGTPLHTAITLSYLKNQQVQWKIEEKSLNMRVSDKNFSLAGLSTEGRIEDLCGVPKFTAGVSLSGLQYPGFHLTTSRIDSKGNEKEISLTVNTQGDVKSSFNILWKPGQITLKKASLSVVPSLLGLKNNKLDVGCTLQSPTTITYAENKNFVVPSLHIAFSPCGNLKLTGKFSEEYLTGSLELSQINLSNLQKIMPSLPGGTLALRANCSGKPMKPDGNFKLILNKIKAEKLPPLDAELKGSLITKGKRFLSVELNLPETTKNILGLNKNNMKAEIPFTTPASGISLPDMTAPVRAAILMEGDLKKLSALLPLADQRIAGNLYADIKLTGSLNSPVFNVHTNIKNAEFLDIAQGVQLKGIQLKADTDNFSIKNSSQGKISVQIHAEDGRKGSIDIAGNVNPLNLLVDLKGKIENFAPLHREDASINLGGTVSVNGSVLSPNIESDIIVNRGNILLSKLPGSNIKTLKIEKPDEPKEIKKIDPGTIKAKISIPNRFFVRGYGLDCEWKGELFIQGPITKPSITGSLQAVRGSLDILTKNFKLSEGQIDFDGGWPVSPLLNVALQYQASSIIAKIAVSGTVGSPKLTLTSDPSLHQDEIISRILFGEGTASLSHFQAVQLAAAAASLTGFGLITDYMGSVRKKLGLDVLKFNSDNDGSKSNASRSTVEAGTYVIDNVYVGVEQELGGKGETGTVVDVELKPGFHIDAKNIGKKLDFGLGWNINY